MISFVAVGVIEILAFTQVLSALTLSPTLVSPVARFNVTPPTTTIVDAFTTVVPATAEVICTVQSPVVPTVVHVFTPPTKLPGPPTIEKLIVVPAGAFANAPEPSFTFTCPVRVWSVLTGFVAVAGLI